MFSLSWKNWGRKWGIKGVWFYCSKASSTEEIKDKHLDPSTKCPLKYKYVISFLKEHSKEAHSEVHAAYIDTMNKVLSVHFLAYIQALEWATNTAWSKYLWLGYTCWWLPFQRPNRGISFHKKNRLCNFFVFALSLASLPNGQLKSRLATAFCLLYTHFPCILGVPCYSQLCTSFNYRHYQSHRRAIVKVAMPSWSKSTLHLLPHFPCVPTWLKIVQHVIFGFKRARMKSKRGVGHGWKKISTEERSKERNKQ